MKNIFIFLLLVSGSLFGQSVTRDTIRVPGADSTTVIVITTTTTQGTGTATYTFPIRNTVTTYFKVPNGTGRANQLPTVSIGSVAAITLPVNSVNLISTSSDPDGSIVKYEWSRVSGSGQYTIQSSNTANTSVIGLAAGTHGFRLVVTDNDGGSASATVSVVVNPEIILPPGGNFQGFGSQTPGGTGQQVVHVTNLTASGSGSIAAAWGSNRTIVFDVSGTIKGWRMPGSGVSFLTLDGTTAPGNGITFEGSSTNRGNIFAFEGSNFNNIILKNFRVRGGVGAKDNDGDGINIVNGAHDIVLDHISTSGNNDGNLDITSGSRNITVQNCIIGPGLGYAGQTNSWWSGNTLIAYNGTQNLSVHHNLFVPKTSGGVGERAPYVHSSDGDSRYTLMVDFRNNAVVNWTQYGSGFGYNAGGHFINNYYKSSSNPNRAIDPNADPTGNQGDQANSQFYISGNVSGDGASFPAGKKTIPFNIPANAQVTTQSACDAATFIKANAGCRPLDAVDQALINQLVIQNCSGIPDPVACTGYTYSAWSACSNGVQSRTVTGTSPNGCTGTPLAQPVLTQTCSTDPNPDGYPGYTLVRSIPFDKASDINSNQLGRGGFSTFGGGSFRSEVRAADAAISSGWRSEQQYGDNETPKEGIYEYDWYGENWGSFDGGGHSVQWHPYTGGASANISLQNYGNRWDVTRAIGSTVTHQQNPPAHVSNRWYKIRWEVRFSTGSDGYIRLFVDGVQTYSHTGKNDDGSGQYFKLGQNRWPDGNGNSMQKTSVCYYKNLKIYKKN